MLENMYVRGIIGGIVMLATYLYGSFDGILLALIAMICIDFITGIITAAALGQVSSQKMFMCGARKVGILLVVAVANVIDGTLVLDGLLRTVTISYFIAHEGISLLENWSLMGLPVPAKLRNVLAVLGKDK